MADTGWQDDRLMEAFDLIYAVKSDYPSDRHVKAACNDALDHIELIDGEMADVNAADSALVARTLADEARS